MFGAVAGLVPGLVAEAGQVEVGAGVVLGRAQRAHAGEGEPGPLEIARGAVDDEDIGHLGAQQADGGGQARLPGADDENVERRGAVGRGPGFEPGHAGVGDAGQVVPGAGGLGTESPGTESLRRERVGEAIRQASPHRRPVRYRSRSWRRRSPDRARLRRLPSPGRSGPWGGGCGKPRGWCRGWRRRPKLRASRGVSIAPGRMVLTRMPSGREVERHRLRQADDGALRGDVGGVVAAAGMGQLRGDGDDAAGACGLHGRQDGAGVAPGAPEVGPQHGVPVGRGDRQRGAARGEAGGGEQDVDAAECREGGGHVGLGLVRGGHVAGAQKGMLDADGVEGGGVAVDQAEPCAVVGEQLGGGAADAGGGAGDEGDLAVQAHGGAHGRLIVASVHPKTGCSMARSGSK